MVAKTLSVITPVWNNNQHTIRYLMQNRSYFSPEYPVEFIVIDNGSTDATATILKSYQDRLNFKVITNKENLGFPAACNQGAVAATGDILLFLNNDVIIYGNYAVGLPDIVTDEILAGPELNAHHTGWNQFGEVRVPYIAGWCLALTKKTFDELGRFDERYSPCDYEDMDLCYAAVKAGKHLLRLTLPIRHLSAGSAMPNRLEITERNRIKFAEKWGLL